MFLYTVFYEPLHNSNFSGQSGPLHEDHLRLIQNQWTDFWRIPVSNLLLSFHSIKQQKNKTAQLSRKPFEYNFSHHHNQFQISDRRICISEEQRFRYFWQQYERGKTDTTVDIRQHNADKHHCRSHLWNYFG